MKTAWAVMVVLIACLLAVDCYAESSSRFQSVGGDFGRNVIGTLKANDTKPAAAGNNSSNSSLWNWGNAPKGSLIQNGKLVADPFNTWKSLNYTDGWIGEVEKDPYTGYPIYAYKIPNTGETRYFYIDPYTGVPIYVERGSGIGTSNIVRSASYALPPVFR
ncbi:MAG: PepSY domain-containing protein [Methanothrix sp.]|nr:PepSY domain-containing protein [Methanothrix sp.]